MRAVSAMTNSCFGCWELVAIMETQKDPNIQERDTEKSRKRESSRHIHIFYPHWLQTFKDTHALHWTEIQRNTNKPKCHSTNVLINRHDNRVYSWTTQWRPSLSVWHNPSQRSESCEMRSCPIAVSAVPVSGFECVHFICQLEESSPKDFTKVSAFCCQLSSTEISVEVQKPSKWSSLTYHLAAVMHFITVHCDYRTTQSENLIRGQRKGTLLLSKQKTAKHWLGMVYIYLLIFYFFIQHLYQCPGQKEVHKPNISDQSVWLNNYPQM